jgi:hypothetical protein
VGGAAEGSLAVVVEFSTLHLRSSFIPGSIAGVLRCMFGGEFYGGGVVDARGGVSIALEKLLWEQF